MGKLKCCFDNKGGFEEEIKDTGCGRFLLKVVKFGELLMVLF